MVTVGSQELHRNTAAVLERVAGGEALTITIDGEPVATLSPVAAAPRYPTTAEFFAQLVPADPAMLHDIRAIRGDQTTDDLAW